MPNAKIPFRASEAEHYLRGSCMEYNNLLGYLNNYIMNRNVSSVQAELKSTSQHAEEWLMVLYAVYFARIVSRQ